MTSIRAIDLTRDQVIADLPDDEDEGAFRFENAYYFPPDAVDAAHLVETDRTYLCPYKGVVHWLDLHGADGKVYHDVGWVAHAPTPGFQRLQDRLAFYKGDRPGIRCETP